jgi:hypothetical protein
MVVFAAEYFGGDPVGIAVLDDKDVRSCADCDSGQRGWFPDACQHVEAEPTGSEQVGAGYAIQAFLIAEHLR